MCGSIGLKHAASSLLSVGKLHKTPGSSPASSYDFNDTLHLIRPSASIPGASSHFNSPISLLQPPRWAPHPKSPSRRAHLRAQTSALADLIAAATGTPPPSSTSSSPSSALDYRSETCTGSRQLALFEALIHSTSTSSHILLRQLHSPLQRPLSLLGSNLRIPLDLMRHLALTLVLLNLVADEINPAVIRSPDFEALHT